MPKFLSFIEPKTEVSVVLIHCSFFWNSFDYNYYINPCCFCIRRYIPDFIAFLVTFFSYNLLLSQPNLQLQIFIFSELTANKVTTCLI